MSDIDRRIANTPASEVAEKLAANDKIRKDMTAVHNKLVLECIELEERLTPWERNFIDSISVALAKDWFLTAKQEATLNKIHRQVTDADCEG